jgi:DNA polymerase III delta subunit
LFNNCIFNIEKFLLEKKFNESSVFIRNALEKKVPALLILSVLAKFIRKIIRVKEEGAQFLSFLPRQVQSQYTKFAGAIAMNTLAESLVLCQNIDENIKSNSKLTELGFIELINQISNHSSFSKRTNSRGP